MELTKIDVKKGNGYKIQGTKDKGKRNSQIQKKGY